jgi:hypothetical protein
MSSLILEQDILVYVNRGLLLVIMSSHAEYPDRIGRYRQEYIEDRYSNRIYI